MIRPATLHDLPAIAAVEAAAAYRPWSERQIEGHLRRTDGLAWVVEQDGVVGHLLATAVLDEGELLMVAVHPRSRRQGLARRLLNTLMASWIDRGVRAGFLEVRVDNAPARALYAAHGWLQVGLRPAYYAGVDAIVMRCEVRHA